MSSLIICPKCGSAQYYRSRTQNLRERIRKTICHQRPYRCHSCDYRGWVFIKTEAVCISRKKYAFYLGIVVLSCLIGLILGSFIN